MKEWFGESLLERQAPGEGKEQGLQRGLGGLSSQLSTLLGRGGQGEVGGPSEVVPVLMAASVLFGEENQGVPNSCHCLLATVPSSVSF